MNVIRSGEFEMIWSVRVEEFLVGSYRLCYVLMEIKERKYVKVLAGKRNILYVQA